MKEFLITLRNKMLHFIYVHMAKPIFFRIDPETIHERMIRAASLCARLFITRIITRCMFGYSNKRLKQTIHGIHFPNPTGLAAGFDKNAELATILPCLGFGFMEVGSITAEPCEGNPKPRLWRLPKSKSLVVYYGLKNKGCNAIAAQLKNRKCVIPLGINIAKTNCRETANTSAGIKDYIKAYSAFSNKGDYTTINISCPNAYGGQPFTDARLLDLLLTAIGKIPSKKPIFLKLSPDLDKQQIDAIIAVADKHTIVGFICTNLTKKRTEKIIEKTIPQQGGLSGKLVDELSTELIRYIYKKTRGKYILIGLGGIFTAEDAYKKINAGASLVQLITGMIYEGPQVISEINQGLVKLLEKDGYSNISEAVGADNKVS